MVEGNSFSNLLKLMKEQGYNKDVALVVAKVVQPSPLVVDMGDFSIYESDGDMFIAETLKTHKRNIQISSDEVNINEGVLTILTPLQAGDKVYVLMDKDDFYVLDKVV